jgi:hypothetical protein
MGTVTIIDINRAQFTFVKAPYACIAPSKSYVYKCFTIALKEGDTFNKNLYDSILNMDRIKQSILSVPCFGEKASKPLPESKSEDQSVIDYLNISSVEYYEDKNMDPVTCLTNNEKNISDGNIKTLLTWWYKQHSIRQLYLLGLTLKEIKSCHMDYNTIYDICVGKNGIPANPFRIAAIPMLTAHTICDQLEVVPHPSHILCGEICRKVREYSNKNSWTCTPMWIMRQKFPYIQGHIKALQDYYFCVFDMDNVYMEYPYKVETTIAKSIDRLIKITAKKVNERHDQYELPRMFVGNNLSLSPGQVDAIGGSLQHNISIITGGPGTGKSTICNEIVKNLVYRNIPYLIGSFTGKAVSRLNQCLVNNVATTLDSMIFKLDRKEYYHLIVDEASMVTTELFYRLDKALEFGYKITIIGDIDQLQPISWGSFMSQLMSCSSIPVYRLMYNFRINGPITEGETKKESNSNMALINANRLIKKDRPLSKPYKFKEGPGFTKVDGNLTVLKLYIQAHKDIIDDHKDKEEKGIYVKNKITLDDIMVICPFNIHCEEINNMFAEVFHSNDKRCIDHKRQVWNEGFRVMMNNNKSDIRVMNGDEGIVEKVESDGITVNFFNVSHKFFYKNREFTYSQEAEVGKESKEEDNFSNLSTEDLTRSYCITVHKAQGSERGYVFVYIPKKIDDSGRVQRFLNINILYTAITRCKKEVYLVGDSETIGVITTQVQQKRCDNLALRIKSLSDENLEEHLKEEVKINLEKAAAEKEDYIEEEDNTVLLSYQEEYDPYDEEEEEGGFFLPIGFK